MKLIDLRMNDASRHFGALPETVSVTEPELEQLRAHAVLLGATNVAVVSDHVTEAWIDFDYQSHHFSLNNQFGDWWFFVDDPACPDDILRSVLAHFATLLA